MNELVSILIPAYNAERWIAQTVASALSQTWPHTEVIVVDDGSSDRTVDIARRFASQGVVVIAQANRGAAAARNTALCAARGSYLQFLDADDLLDPQKIAAQLNCTDHGTRHSTQNSTPSGLQSRTLLTSAWARFVVRPEQAQFTPDSLWADHSPINWLITKFSDNRFMFPASWLVSRRLAEEAGPWNEQLSLDDDGEYVCRLVAASEEVRFVPDARSYYRVGNAGSLSTQKSDRALRSGAASLQLCIAHLLQLEDSARTRSASVKLLQDSLHLYYPEQTELVAQCQALATALGGELTPPHERLHFRCVRQLVGWRAAKQLRGRLNALRLLGERTVDGWRPIGTPAPHTPHALTHPDPTSNESQTPWQTPKTSDLPTLT